MKRGRVKGGSIIPATIDTGRRTRSSMAQPVFNAAGSTRGLMGGAAENVIAITENDLKWNGGNYSLIGGTPIPMQIVTGRRSKQGAALVVYPVDANGDYDPTFAGIVYLLRDEFTNNLAAGAVNGTAAEPGPGTRVVVDTDNKLTIAAGACHQEVHTVPAFGDPGLWYGAITRAAGIVYLAKVNLTVAGSQIGFDIDQLSDLASEHYFFFLSSTILDVRIGVAPFNLRVADHVLGTDYQLAVVLRAAGGFYFIRGGAFTDWTLLWPDAIRNTATLFPGAIVGNTALGEVDIDYIRIPEELWLPAPLLSDSFNRANGALGNTDGAGHAEANGGGGVAWNNRIGTTQIAANTASASALVGGIAIANVDAGNINVLHEAELTRVAGNVGIVLRYVDAANYVYAHHDGVNANLTKRVAGAETPLLAVAAAYAAGAVMRVICEGTSFALYYNNVKIGATQVIADAALQTGTECGLYSSNVGNSQDDMVTWARNTGYSRLDAF